MEDRYTTFGEYVVHREVLDESRLDVVAQKGTWSTKPTVGERMKDMLRCSSSQVKDVLLTRIPILSWLPKYPFRENIVGDVMSGCSVGIIHLPQGMAYALLASLRPVLGLYTSLYPVLVYCIFGTSRHISIGTFAVISIMVGSVIERLAPNSNFIVNGTNGSGIVNLTARDSYRAQVACSLTVLTGIFQILLGLVKFDFIVTYLSEPLIRGYTTASACHVCISQLKYVFGVSPAHFTGPFSIVYTVVDVCRLLPQARVPELVISLVAFSVLFSVKQLNDCFRQKISLPIPIELVVIITATVITYFCGLASEYSIDVIGEIPSGLKPPRTPDVTLFSKISSDAFAVAIVGFAISISLGKTFALKHGYKVDSNQELVSLGLCNTVGGMFRCYVVTSSLSRSLVQESTGGRTQIAGMVSSVIVLIAVLKIGSLFEDLPKAVLSTIVFVNLRGMFKQFMDIPMLWKTNKVDLLVWMVTYISTILLNLDLGLAVSIGFSMLTIIIKTQRPRYSILGNVPGTELYLDIDAYKEAKEIPGIKIFHSSATINFTNADMYLESLQEKSGIDIGKLQTEKKKQEAKQRREQERLKKRERNEAKRNRLNKNTDNQNGVVLSMPGTASDISGKGQINWGYSDKVTSDSDSDSYEVITVDSNEGEDGRKSNYRSGTHSIILDVTLTSSMDTVAVKTLKNIFRDFGDVGVAIYLAGCQACVVEQMERANFFSESVPKSRLFVSVHDAVLHMFKKRGQEDNGTALSCDTQM
ncbi:solute carrier family 26 member 6-like [Poeciliopsis prolifica]|uniref:solute carrier family 26 member 6-like n=1 Tax=Poeciliopsis prolifica TaxID=188132 RepID=UPI00072D1A79|nr:solute carrier family 26 member 6-like [Poeciliopsis prolifica]